MRKKGFTLIELLIFMGILTVLLLVLTQIFVSVIDSRLESESLSSIEQDGNYIMARLMYDIERSTNIITPATPGAHGSTLQIVVDGVTNTYTLNGSNIQLTNGAGTDRLNGYDTTISSLDFKRVSTDSAITSPKDSILVNITVVSQTTRRVGTESRSYQITAASR